MGEVALAMLETTKCRMVAVEPFAFHLRAHKYNLRGTDSVLVVAAAWKDELTPVMSFDGNTIGDTSIIQNEQSMSVEGIMVRTLDAILDRAGLSDENIQLLKIDAEGAEPEVLLAAPQALTRTALVAVDAGPERGTEASRLSPHATQCCVRPAFGSLATSIDVTCLCIRSSNLNIYHRASKHECLQTDAAYRPSLSSTQPLFSKRRVAVLAISLGGPGSHAPKYNHYGARPDRIQCAIFEAGTLGVRFYAGNTARRAQLSGKSTWVALAMARAFDEPKLLRRRIECPYEGQNCE